MDWNDHQRAVELAGATAATVCLGAAVGFGIVALTPLAGLALAAAASCGGAAAAAAVWVLLGRVDSAGKSSVPAFAPVDLPTDGLGELLLDDPIVVPAPDSRVVRLFGDQPLPEPGELALRIDDYLDEGRGASRRGSGERRVDASAALHAALADIRRSLG
ncbi:MAG: hypothetical protein M3Q83_01325 [Pseudomonadota bacterium]|nr:hypothetical protein [Pseudomonadota bacterium]